MKEAVEEPVEEEKVEEEPEVEEEDVPDEEEPNLEEEMKAFSKIDVFGVENILDIGDNKPLFQHFNFEDWTMLSLRYEIHLLAHSFRKDVTDPDRVGIHADHLAYYYNRYFKKQLNLKFYGVETIDQLLEYVTEVVAMNEKTRILEPLLGEEVEFPGVFAMITEEDRRDRARRVDMGEESAKLKLSQQAGGLLQLGGLVAGMPIRPVAGLPVAARPTLPAWAGMGAGGAPMRPGLQAGAWPATARPAMGMGMGMGVRPAMGAWGQMGGAPRPAWPGAAGAVRPVWGAAAAWR